MTTTNKQSYPSDLADWQWTRLEPLLPPAKSVGRHRLIDLRAVANAINYRWETGCAWRMLPHDFPPWGTVYAYFRTWQRAGVIRQFRGILLEPKPKKSFRPLEPVHHTMAPANPAREAGRPAPSEHTKSGFSSPLDRSGDSTTPSHMPHALPPFVPR